MDRSPPAGSARADPVRFPRDPDYTRARILQAATLEFHRFGLGGARVDRIAAEAGVNKRMLYYYFGSKDDLFLAVLEAVYEAIRSEERALEMDRLDPAEAIRQLVAFTWRYYLAHPEFLTLLNSANLHEGRHLKKSTRVQSLHSPLVRMLADVLRRGRDAGRFRDGVDPVQLYISIAGLCYFYLGNRHTLAAIFDRDLMAPEALDTRLHHVIDVILGYLSAGVPGAVPGGNGRVAWESAAD
jgi:AcrR family transcriptional regulator